MWAIRQLTFVHAPCTPSTSKEIFLCHSQHNPRLTWIKSFEVLKSPHQCYSQASLNKPNIKYISLTGNNWKHLWLHPCEGTFYLQKNFFYHLLNNDFHYFTYSKKYKVFWIGNRHDWRMNLIVILFLAMNSAPGIRTFSKVIYDVPVNLYMVP